MPKTTYLEMDKRTGYLQEANPPQIPDDRRAIPSLLAGERGSTWDSTRLFEWYEEGLIFLRGAVEDFEIEAMLRTDGHARAVEQVLTLPVRGARWEIEAGENDKGERDYAMDLLTRPGAEGGMQTPISNVIAQTCSAFLYRSSCFEKVFKLNDQGMVVYDKIAWRPPTTCYLARSATTAQLEGFLQWTWTNIASFQRIYIPSAKAFTYLHGTHRDPILGSSDIEVTYRSFQTKQKLRFLWAAYLENQVVPKIVATKSNGSEQSAADLARKAATLKGGGAIGIVEGDKLEAFESAQNGGAVFLQAITYLDDEMYASILANFLGLATATGVRGSSGGAIGQSLSLSQTDFFLQNRHAAMTEMGDAITHQLVAPMIKWNFGAGASCPRFKFVSLAPTSNITEAAIQMVASVMGQPPVPLQPGDTLPQSSIPTEFQDELIEKVAGMLNLDTRKIADAIRKRGTEIHAKVPGLSDGAAGIHAAADVATSLAAGGANGNGTPAPVR